jgi:hypothetical protein
MNSIAKPSFYFSAYPLKVIKDSSVNKEPSSPYLKALLSGTAKSRSRGKVLPMINPYNNQFSPAPVEDDKLPKDIELTEKDWFKHYE